MFRRLSGRTPRAFVHKVATATSCAAGDSLRGLSGSNRARGVNRYSQHVTEQTKRLSIRTFAEGIAVSLIAAVILLAAQKLPQDALEWVLSLLFGLGGMVAFLTVINRKMVPWAEKHDGAWPGFLVLGVGLVGGTAVAMGLASVGIYVAGIIQP